MSLRKWLKSLTPQPLRRYFRYQQWRFSVRPPIGWLRFGSFRRLTPISRNVKSLRGQPITRYYVDEFLRGHSRDIQGRVLEMEEPEYIRKFGDDRVTSVDILHAVSGNPQANLVGDLATGEGVPEGVYDCIILTQTLFLIYDVRGAVFTCFRALKPGGIILVTVPGISKISRYDMDRWGEYWRFTSLSARRLFEEAFLPQNVSVQVYGNVLTAICSLQGVASQELTAEELASNDPDFELMIAVRAVK